MPKGRRKATYNKELGAKVSVLIPTFNRQGMVVEALQSVVNQTFKDWQCLIYDDGSNDDTRQAIIDFIDAQPPEIRQRFVFQEGEYNQGQGHARKHLIKIWKKYPTKWACWCDADDSLAPDRLQKQYTLAEQGDYDVVFGYLQFWYPHKRNIKRLRKIDVSKYDPYNLWSINNNTNTATAFFNAKVGKLVLKQHPINQGNWDGLWHWQIIRNKCKIGLLPQVIYNCRQHDGRIVRRKGTNAWLLEQPIIRSEYERITHETAKWWKKKPTICYKDGGQ